MSGRIDFPGFTSAGSLDVPVACALAFLPLLPFLPPVASICMGTGPEASPLLHCRRLLRMSDTSFLLASELQMSAKYKLRKHPQTRTETKNTETQVHPEIHINTHAHMHTETEPHGHPHLDQHRHRRTHKQKQAHKHTHRQGHIWYTLKTHVLSPASVMDVSASDPTMASTDVSFLWAILTIRPRPFWNEVKRNNPFSPEAIQDSIRVIFRCSHPRFMLMT